MMSNEANERLKRDTQYVPLTQNAEEKHSRYIRHYQTDRTLQISEARSVKKTKLVRFLWQFIRQSRFLTVSVQK